MILTAYTRPRRPQALALLWLASCGRSELAQLDVQTVADAPLPGSSGAAGRGGTASEGQGGAGGGGQGGALAGQAGTMAGQAGTGSAGGAPMAVASPLSCGFMHSCAVRADGGVRCWGASNSGSLGLGDSESRGDQPGEMGDALPAVYLGAGQSLRALSVSYAHSCALLEGGRVKCWGQNFGGILGLGDSKHRGDQPGEMGDDLPFVDLGAQVQVRALQAGSGHTCALLEGDAIKCWGDNGWGQLGLGDTTSRGSLPGHMGDALPIVDLGAGVVTVSTGDLHTCALLKDGRIKCWGGNDLGRLGLGDTVWRGDGPGEMGAMLPAVDLGGPSVGVAAGGGHTCALLEGGRVKCWGINSEGTLGLGDSEHRGDQPGEMGDNLPFVDLGTGVRAVALSTMAHHTCALLEGGRVKCWGMNYGGALGLGDNEHRGDQPGEMGDNLPFVDLGAGARVVALSAGTAHTCAWLEGGTLRCWGVNNGGQLGLGDLDSRGAQPGEMGAALPAVDLGTTSAP